jgi:hypothetical protein
MIQIELQFGRVLCSTFFNINYRKTNLPGSRVYYFAVTTNLNSIFNPTFLFLFLGLLPYLIHFDQSHVFQIPTF